MRATLRFSFYSLDLGLHACYKLFATDKKELQADTVILTSNNPRGETPGSIIADTIAGYPDELLAYNARQAYTTGFLHDPGRIPLEALEFSWQNSFECASTVMPSSALESLGTKTKLKQD